MSYLSCKAKEFLNLKKFKKYIRTVLLDGQIKQALPHIWHKKRLT